MKTTATARTQAISPARSAYTGRSGGDSLPSLGRVFAATPSAWSISQSQILRGMNHETTEGRTS